MHLPPSTMPLRLPNAAREREADGALHDWHHEGAVVVAGAFPRAASAPHGVQLRAFERSAAAFAFSTSQPCGTTLRESLSLQALSFGFRNRKIPSCEALLRVSFQEVWTWMKLGRSPLPALFARIYSPFSPMRISLQDSIFLHHLSNIEARCSTRREGRGSA